jgi:hypothetical protein
MKSAYLYPRADSAKKLALFGTYSSRYFYHARKGLNLTLRHTQFFLRSYTSKGYLNWIFMYPFYGRATFLASSLTLAGLSPTDIRL